MVEVTNRAVFDERRKELTATRTWLMNKKETIENVKRLKVQKKHAEDEIKRLKEEIDVQDLTVEEVKLKESLEKIEKLKNLDEKKKQLEVAEKALGYITEDLTNFEKAIGGRLKL